MTDGPEPRGHLQDCSGNQPIMTDTLSLLSPMGDMKTQGSHLQFEVVRCKQSITKSPPQTISVFIDKQRGMLLLSSPLPAPLFSSHRLSRFFSSSLLYSSPPLTFPSLCSPLFCCSPHLPSPCLLPSHQMEQLGGLRAPLRYLCLIFSPCVSELQLRSITADRVCDWYQLITTNCVSDYP